MNCGEERKKARKVLFTETDVGRVQTGHTQGKWARIFKFLPPGSISNGAGRGGAKTLRDGFFGETQTDGSLKRHSAAQGARKPRA